VNPGEALRVHWWRGTAIVASLAVCAVALGAGLFGLVPILLWCSIVRSSRTGFAGGVVLVALHAWFVLPRELGWSGAWVPSAIEAYWLYPVLAAVVTVVGLLVERRPSEAPSAGTVSSGFSIAGYVVVGFVCAAYLGIMGMESKPEDEGVLPGPAGLRLVEGGGGCGSGNCWRTLDATGDGAPEAMRTHLASRGYAPRAEHWCRQNGLVVVHEVCADLSKETPTSVQVTWYVN
jgi:hypothetical protein